jgi:hypothetical protein
MFLHAFLSLDTSSLQIGHHREPLVSLISLSSLHQGWDGKTVSVFDLEFVLKTVSKKLETVSHGFSIHFSSDYWYLFTLVVHLGCIPLIHPD